MLKRDAEGSSWQFWQYQLVETGEYFLYAWFPGTPTQQPQALHLGAFMDTASLAVQQVRFIEEPRTCVALELDAAAFATWLENPLPEQVPEFLGQFGSPWSGYGIRKAEEHKVEVIYAADRRHEWIGVFSQAEAFAWIELDYDRRRRRCLLC